MVVQKKLMGFKPLGEDLGKRGMCTGDGQEVKNPGKKEKRGGVSRDAEWNSEKRGKERSENFSAVRRETKSVVVGESGRRPFENTRNSAEKTWPLNPAKTVGGEYMGFLENFFREKRP